jgi:hypothetical protein
MRSIVLAAAAIGTLAMLSAISPNGSDLTRLAFALGRGLAGFSAAMLTFAALVEIIDRALPSLEPTQSGETLTLAELSEKATPGPWNIEDGSIVNRELDDPKWDSNENGEIAWDVAQVYAPANAAFIVACVNRVRSLLSTPAGRAVLEGDDHG